MAERLSPGGSRRRSASPEPSSLRKVAATFRALPPALQLLLALLMLVLLYSSLPRYKGLLFLCDVALWSGVLLGVLYSSGQIDQIARSLSADRALAWLTATPVPPMAKPAPFDRFMPPRAGSVSPGVGGRTAGATGNLDALRQYIVRSIEESLLGQSKAAEALASATVSAFTERRSGAYLVLICAGPGSGRTTMLAKLHDCLATAEILSEFVHASDPSRNILDLVKHPVVLVDDLDKQPAAMREHFDALVKGRPDGPTLIVFATRDGMTVDDPLVQPKPLTPSDFDRMLGHISGFSGSRINSLIVPEVPPVRDMLALASSVFMTRCKNQGLRFDANLSADGLISIIASSHDRSLASHPGTWLASIETKADRELASVAHSARERAPGAPAIKVALIADKGVIELREVL